MRLVAAELLKVWTAPKTLIGLIAAELVIVGIGTASAIDSALSSGDLPPDVIELARPRLEHDLIEAATASLLFAVILGILVITWEYRHGTITHTFLVTPARDRVLAAKTLVGGLLGAALVAPALILMLVIAEIWVGDRLHFGEVHVEQAARLFLAAAIVAVLGVEIGASTGRQLGAIIIVFAWAIFAEPALGIWGGLSSYLPFAAIDGVLGSTGGQSGDESLSFLRGLLTIGAYVVALGTLALVLTRRRDIT